MIKYLTLALAIFFTSFAAEARVRIDITNPNADPFPVALTEFVGESRIEQDYAERIREVIAYNLRHSAIFRVIDQQAHLQTNSSIELNGPEFNEWRVIGAEALLAGDVEIVQENGQTKVQVSFRFWDVADEKQIVGWRYKVDAKFWRYLAHLISDRIYTGLTGENGYFATRIVYIGEEDNLNCAGHKIKRLCVMDQDGGNQQCLTDGQDLVLTPRFNPQAQKIIYMSYAKRVPRLYILDLPTGRQELLGDFEGLNSSPRFSPDGKSVVMTLTKGHAGNPEIYHMDLATRNLKRLTYHRGIDTSPSFSPDGKRIVFNSDRGGSPELYIMDVDGNSVERLTFGQGSYYAPEWSPRGDLIAFVKKLGSRFSIGVIDPNGDEERLLTDSFMDESPTWSPNGRVIIFARQLGDTTRLYSIDLTGYNERQLPTPTDASDPAWSPLLQ